MRMKKVIYAILTGIILAGIVVIATIGLEVDLAYSKNVELNVYIGKTFDKSDIEDIATEVFDGDSVMVQEIELFEDMVSIKVPDTRSEDELNTKVEELNNRINEKYEIENTVEDIEITHNPKIRLSSIILPYVAILGISLIIIFIFVGIRYKRLGIVRTILRYTLTIGISELLLLSIIAIIRIPVNRIVIPLGLLLLVMDITVLGFMNEKKLEKAKEKSENDAKSKKTKKSK